MLDYIVKANQYIRVIYALYQQQPIPFAVIYIDPSVQTKLKLGFYLYQMTGNQEKEASYKQSLTQNLAICETGLRQLEQRYPSTTACKTPEEIDYHLSIMTHLSEGMLDARYDENNIKIWETKKSYLTTSTLLKHALSFASLGHCMIVVVDTLIMNYMERRLDYLKRCFSRSDFLSMQLDDALNDYLNDSELQLIDPSTKLEPTSASVSESCSAAESEPSDLLDSFELLSTEACSSSMSYQAAPKPIMQLLSPESINDCYKTLKKKLFDVSQVLSLFQPRATDWQVYHMQSLRQMLLDNLFKENLLPWHQQDWINMVNQLAILYHTHSSAHPDFIKACGLLIGTSPLIDETGKPVIVIMNCIKKLIKMDYAKWHDVIHQAIAALPSSQEPQIAMLAKVDLSAHAQRWQADDHFKP